MKFTTRLKAVGLRLEHVLVKVALAPSLRPVERIEARKLAVAVLTRVGASSAVIAAVELLISKHL